MKSTYKLAWEEFAEVYQDSWPHPDYFVAIMVVIVMAPLIAYGVTMAVLAPSEKVAYLFVAGPPVLLVVAMISSVKSEVGKKLNQAIAERRAAYDRWCAQEQSFSFDQEKWTRETQSGKQEVVWASLLQALEFRNVLHLVGETGDLTVPKRALLTTALSSRACASRSR